MTEQIDIPILCPMCNKPLVKSRYASKGKWVTWWRIRCTNEPCKIDTGRQPTLSDVYEALSVFYFGAISNNEYKHITDTDDAE
jgi:hypothetical protein